MEIHKIRPHITVSVPEGTIVSQEGCNVGFIHTNEGIIVIDTSVSVKRMGEILMAAEIRSGDICLVVNTHLHADHINGNSLFQCPVICHSKAKARMEKKCTKQDQPLITFDDEYDIDAGNIHLRLIHTGGHTPESIVVWLPEEKLLFSGDLLFVGRAPFMASVTNFNTLVKALKWLSALGAEVIVPGHGPLCDEIEVQAQLNYLDTTWKIIKSHVENGQSLTAIRKDPALPFMEGRNFERNIEWIYKRLAK